MFGGIHFGGDDLTAWFKRINLRVLLVAAAVVGSAGVMIVRLFNLQIVNGESYMNNFQLRIKREISIPGTRGNIYDRNGQLLAYNELAYSVVLRDTAEESSHHDMDLNDTIAKALDIIESNGDTVTSDFKISYNKTTSSYEFTVDGRQLTRFLADVYGYADTADLKPKEAESSADDVMLMLCKRFEIGKYEKEGDPSSAFVPEEGYKPKKLLQMVTIRYLLSLNAFKRYMPTTIASDVSGQTVATLLENTDSLEGINIEDTTVRRYVDSKYFAQILGYTGQVSTDELEDLQKTNPSYDASDVVGKSGLEKSLESVLQGTKGKKTVYVDNLGNELETTNVVNPSAGSNVYLTIDKDLQEAAYDILEKKLADIILDKIRPIKEYKAKENASSASILIPIYTVYFHVLDNNIVDIGHFQEADAGPTEKAVYSAYSSYLSTTMERLRTEMFDTKTPYKDLSDEYKDYESYIIQFLYSEGVLDKAKVDKDDETYTAWAKDETISMAEFLKYCIAKGWIDVSQLDMKQQYADSEAVYNALYSWLQKNLSGDLEFTKHLYHYMILQDIVTGTQVCQLLLEQKCVTVPESEKQDLASGAESSYTFMTKRIENRDLTPAQLNLDPYSGSIVITDPNNGQVLAMVSYPSFDNNKMANGVDADYYESLREDRSKPLINYATQQRTAPGSTFKPVTATAALSEGVIDLNSTVTCTGIFTKLGNPAPKCWIYPAGHGTLDVVGGIEHSCNVFFYEMGYRLATDTDGSYKSELGIEKLRKYAQMYGLGDKSGVEIEEAAPLISSEDAVRSAIGQGNSNYTTAGLARYVSAVANEGTVYDLTLVDKVTDIKGNILQTNEAGVRNVINMDQSNWDAIHQGMRKVVQNMTFFGGMNVEVAGKTGTAQESELRPNHALFVGFAPYDKPQIAFAIRIANGYTSSYAAQTMEKVLEYYFHVSDKEELLSAESNVVHTTTGD